MSCATDIRGRARLCEIIGGPIDDILASAEWFDHDGRTILSPAGTLQLVEAACRAHPIQVLDLVIEQEAQSRHKCKFGGDHRVGRDSRSTTPEWEYDWYRRHDRPRHELLRQWCGHRAVTHHERFLAAEAATHRLDILVTDLLKALDNLGEHEQAARFAKDHECDRITPHTMRPVVERPLHPSESGAAGGERPSHRRSDAQVLLTKHVGAVIATTERRGGSGLTRCERVHPEPAEIVHAPPWSSRPSTAATSPAPRH
ncbi:hypothetical protein [Micromonospora sp. NPDC049240]|uniref:hypothetical protein n=1 Tax=Micromonospora sp. NPDC049240 TaxID=3155151 RepID=UPI0033F7EE19